VRYETFAAVTIKVTVFWNVKLSSLVNNAYTNASNKLAAVTP